MAYSDAKLEVREEAKKGLKFPDMTFRSRDGIEAAEYRKLLPSLNAVVELLYSRSRLAPAVSAAGNAGVRYVGGLAAETFTRSLEFLRRLIIITAEPFEGKKVVLEAEEFGGLDDFGGAVITGSLRIEVRAHLRKGWVADQDAVMDYSEMMDIDERKDGESGMETYLNLIEKALSAQEAGR